MNIKQFTTGINSRGILKNNKYLVSIAFPKDHYVAGATEALRLVQARCDSVSLPGVGMASADGPPRLGYGPMEKHPYSATFEDLSLTFMTDANSDIHKLFFQWVNSIVGFNIAQGASNLTKLGGVMGGRAYEVGYRDKYAATLTVDVYKESGGKSMSFKAYNAFPMGFPSAGLSWNEGDILKLTIPFAYTDYTVQYSNTGDAPVETGRVDQQVQTGRDVPVTGNPFSRTLR